MTFREAQLSLQLATEERAGQRLRDLQRQVLARQDAAVSALEASR